jgi:ferredoxin--NADP+ reductase
MGSEPGTESRIFCSTNMKRSSLQVTHLNIFPQAGINAIVTPRLDIYPHLIIIRVAGVGWELPGFELGQFNVPGLPWVTPYGRRSDPGQLIREADLIDSSSSVHEILELYINLVSSGVLTPRLFELNTGDRTWLSPKETRVITFEDVPEDMNFVLITACTVLAPCMRILSTLLHCGSSHFLAVLHTARRSWGFGSRSDLLPIQHFCDENAYATTINHLQGEPVLKKISA